MTTKKELLAALKTAVYWLEYSDDFRDGSGTYKAVVDDLKTTIKESKNVKRK